MYEAAGLTVINELSSLFTEAQVVSFYKEHEDKFFFDGLVLSMISGRCHSIQLEGQDAINLVRKTNGATDPAKAEPGTIRHDIRSAGGPFNTVPGSDSQQAFERELIIAFDPQPQ